MRIFAKPS
jgi:hypothetical protein